MNDLKSKEPLIQVLQPLLIHHGVDAAILYGFLRTCCAVDTIDPSREKEIYTFSLKRPIIANLTGLTFGRQMDAESLLGSAGLISTTAINSDRVEYWVYPENEDVLRRHLYSKKYNWA